MFDATAGAVALAGITASLTFPELRAEFKSFDTGGSGVPVSSLYRRLRFSRRTSHVIMMAMMPTIAIPPTTSAYTGIASLPVEGVVVGLDNVLWLPEDAEGCIVSDQGSFIHWWVNILAVGVTVNNTVEGCPFAAVIVLETTDTKLPVSVTSVVGGLDVVAAITDEV